MEPQTKTSARAKDFFINLAAVAALYTLVVSLLNLLFAVINTAYPQITNGYDYYGSQSISWPVAILIIFFPIFILLMWLLGKEYTMSPEKKNIGVHRWLTYITLFISGIALAGDLVTVLYYFIDGQELTTGFFLKILSVFVVALAIFLYYISDIRSKLTKSSKIMWRIIAVVIVLGSIIWGFSVLGLPRTQRLYKFDEQKISDLQNINNQIQNYFYEKKVLPKILTEMPSLNSGYGFIPIDQQTGKSYEYIKTSETAYQLCAEFNKSSRNNNSRSIAYSRYYNHPAGHHCFSETITPSQYPSQYPSPKPLY